MIPRIIKRIKANRKFYLMNLEILSVHLSCSKSPKKGRPATGSNLDRRRKIHVKCEHRRRQDIQEALEALEAELPNTHKARSKGAIIVESADLIKELTFTLDRLLNENQSLLNRLQVSEFTK